MAAVDWRAGAKTIVAPVFRRSGRMCRSGAAGEPTNGATILLRPLDRGWIERRRQGYGSRASSLDLWSPNLLLEPPRSAETADDLGRLMIEGAKGSGFRPRNR